MIATLSTQHVKLNVDPCERCFTSKRSDCDIMFEQSQSGQALGRLIHKHLCEARGSSAIRMYVSLGAHPCRQAVSMRIAYRLPFTFYTVDLVAAAAWSSMASIKQVAELRVVPPVLLQAPPANSVLGGMSLGASLAYAVVTSMEVCCESARAMLVLDDRRRTPNPTSTAVDLRRATRLVHVAEHGQDAFFFRTSRQFAENMGANANRMDNCFETSRTLRIIAPTLDFVAHQGEDLSGRNAAYFLHDDDIVNARRPLYFMKGGAHYFVDADHFTIADGHYWDIAARIRCFLS